MESTYQAVELVIHCYRISFNASLGEDPRLEVIVFRVGNLNKTLASYGIGLLADFSFMKD